LSRGLFALALLAAACAPPGRAIVAEVYYDAIGDDSGHEFVELMNPGAVAVALDGLRLEAGDGAGPGRWSLEWTGGALDSIAPGGRFVIGGARVEPPPQALATLDLQNGPDAVRLVWPDGAVEVVGWGAHAHAEYFCVAPAADAPSGSSLARVPDAADLGGNAADFRAAAPSPGRANQSRRNLALLAGSLAISPEWPDPGHAATAIGRLANAGVDTIGVGELTLGVEIEGLDTPGAAPARARGAARIARPASDQPPVLGPLVILPGDTLTYEIPLDPLEAGGHRLRVTASVPRDEVPGDDRDTLRFLVGPGPLAVTEIQFHPEDGEGEWVEVRNRAPAPLDPAEFTLSDRGSARGVPRDGLGPLPPDSLAVLAQDRAALLAAHPALDPARVWQVSPWAALNNSDDSAGVADIVVIRDRDGLAGERIAYQARGVPGGVPIEWRDHAWLPGLDPRGSPLAPPRTLPPASRRLELAPSRVPAGAGRVRLAWALPWPRARIRADLYDLDGRRIAELLPESGAAGRGAHELSLAGIAPAVYWVVLESRSEAGGERVVDARPLRVVGRP